MWGDSRSDGAMHAHEHDDVMHVGTYIGTKLHLGGERGKGVNVLQ